MTARKEVVGALPVQRDRLTETSVIIPTNVQAAAIDCLRRWDALGLEVRDA